VAAKGRPGSAYHVGGGSELSNTGLTERLLALLGRDWSAVERVADRKGHDLRYSVHASKIRAELGFTPRVALTDGLAATVRWYRENRSWWQPLLRHPQP
jgi:dTDP-glucose 4,6-dehydratase